MIRLHREFRCFDSLSPVAIEGLGLELLAVTCRSSGAASRRPRWLEQAREIVHERCAEPMSVTAIAHEVGVHPVHLAQVFRREFGQTCGDYIRRRRIELACRRLVTTDDPLADIALDAGFADQSHFSRTFRRVVGTTPADYRRARRPR
jgi:AraC family transcriptional regulator